MNLDELMEFLIVNDMVDENFGLKEQDEENLETEEEQEEVKKRVLEKDKYKSLRRY